jgi:hypothetical protein
MVYMYGLTLNLTLPPGGSPSGVSVFVQDGDYTETISTPNYLNPDGTITISAAGERAGNYTITASYVGRTPQVRTVTVTQDSCHVNGQVVSISL